MITVTLTPDLEQVIAECAEQQGTTPELYILDELRTRYLPTTVPASEDAEPRSETMADFFKGYAGTIHSGEIVPGGANLSKNSGQRFKELLRSKHRDGKL